MSEVNKALDRLRRLAAGDSYGEVYTQHGLGGTLDRDTWTVSGAYLIELDPTPVDEAWVKSVAVEILPAGHRTGSGERFVLGRSRNGLRFSLWHQYEQWSLNGICDSPTRGQVRTACRLFGIELKETE